VVPDHISPLLDAHEVVRGGLALPPTGKREVHVIRLRRPALRRLVHHQVATAPLHRALVLLDRVEQAGQLVARLSTSEGNPTLAQTVGSLARDALEFLAALGVQLISARRVAVVRRRFRHVGPPWCRFNRPVSAVATEPLHSK
jgi:hypothetical protein